MLNLAHQISPTNLNSSRSKNSHFNFYNEGSTQRENREQLFRIYLPFLSIQAPKPYLPVIQRSFILSYCRSVLIIHHAWIFNHHRYNLFENGCDIRSFIKIDSNKAGTQRETTTYCAILLRAFHAYSRAASAELLCVQNGGRFELEWIKKQLGLLTVE